MKWPIAYGASALTFGLLDAVWLNWAGPNLYQPVIGEIMHDGVRWGAALSFYTIYMAGIVWFAVRPALETGKVQTALLNGALLGGLCYATFDLTSQAVIKVWATHITLADITWGAFITGVTASIATWVTLKLA